jgi:hypothetical protein
MNQLKYNSVGEEVKLFGGAMLYLLFVLFSIFCACLDVQIGIYLANIFGIAKYWRVMGTMAWLPALMSCMLFVIFVTRKK